MTARADVFSEAQRTSIGSAIALLHDHVRTLRGLKVDGAYLDRIEQELDAMANATAARTPAPPGNALGATLVHMLVLEEDLRPARMRAYGDVTDDAVQILDEHVQRLVDLTRELMTLLEGGSG